MISATLAFLASIVTGIGFFIIVPMLVVFSLWAIGDDEAPSNGVATFFFLLIAGIVQYNFRLPLVDWLIVLPAWLVIGIGYSAFAWYRAFQRLRDRITKWWNDTVPSYKPDSNGRYRGEGSTGRGTVLQDDFHFLSNRVYARALVADRDGNLLTPTLSDTLMEVATDTKPTEFIGHFGYWILLWPIYILKELTRNLVSNIVRSLGTMYTSLAKKAMGVG